MTKEQLKSRICQQIDLMDDREVDEFSIFLQEEEKEEHIAQELVIIKGEFKKLTKLVYSMESKLNQKQKELEKTQLQSFFAFEALLKNAKDAIDSLPKASLFGISKLNRTIHSIQEGFGSLSQEYATILELLGIQYAAKVGDRFNADFHEAVEVIEDQTQEDGAIVEIFEEGFLYQNQIINYAKVKVNRWTL
ncbi:MAG: hypothetical protein KU28_02075 [Sulfurovum sp. PC08-66]|nr:MAG: hypothetical protein KU28_02075 [Sulfurovum sp. PC08-66]